MAHIRYSPRKSGKIFDLWNEQEGRDPWKYDLREATCRWVVENYDLVESFIPRTHPRVMVEDSNSRKGLNISALVVACIALILVITSGVGVFRQRHKRSIQRAQLEFISLLLLGLVMVAIAAVLLTMPPTDETCTATAWMINLG